MIRWLAWDLSQLEGSSDILILPAHCLKGHDAVMISICGKESESCLDPYKQTIYI